MTKVNIARAITAVALAGCMAAAPVLAVAATYEGDANVDQRHYPETTPFIHPPFYNVLVQVETDDDGVITAVTDNGTGGEGSVQEGNEEFWAKKNQPFYQTAVDSGIYDKFVGMTLDDVKAMDMAGVDATAGATEAGAAIQEAVVNALEGRAGKTFLLGEGCLLLGTQGEDGVITFDSSLPEDFELELLDIRYGVCNAEEDIVDPESYTFEIVDGVPTLTFEDVEALSAGIYYVNVVDASGTYRSPAFEGGPEASQAGRFYITNDAEVSFDGQAITLSEGEVADYVKNIDFVSVTPQVAEDEAAADEAQDAKEAGEAEEGKGDGSITIEQVGHHGTVSDLLVFDADGVIVPDAVQTARDGSETIIFEDGVTYDVAVEAFGYQSLHFEFSK